MPMKFTKTAIDGLSPKDKIYREWDQDIKGFGVRVSPSGRKAFFIQYTRPDGKKDSFTIGAYGTLSLKQAQDIARAKIGDIRAGNNPKADKVRARQYPSLKEFMALFIQDYAKHNVKEKTLKGYEGVIRSAIIPALGNKRIDTIETQDISRLKNSYADKPYQANQIIAILSKAYNWALEESLYKDLINPCANVKKYGKKQGVKSRERYLTAEEISRLSKVFRRMENGKALVMFDMNKQAFDENKALKRQYNPDTGIYAVAALMLMFLTGCRKDEILTLKWEYIDIDNKMIRLPDSKTGSKVVFFDEHALGILNRLKAFEAEKAEQSKDIQKAIRANPYVIKGKHYESRLIGIQKVWEGIRESIGINDVRIHDIRHTFASQAVSSGASLPLIGKLLGHSEPATTARYAHLYDDPQRALNSKVSKEIYALMGA